jgi:hypothetical protein
MTKQTVTDILIIARKLIEKEENWTQGAYARLPDGTPTDEDGPSVSCYCSLGALSKAGNFWTPQKAYDYLYAAMGSSITDFNDTHTHAEVLAAFDAAIEASKKEEG